jgi:DNA-binding response OmpR family regulator
MGAAKKLVGARVLIVGDNFLIAEQLSRLVQDEGGLVVGPAATSQMACALIVSRTLDGALLDINLQSEDSSPVARLLEERHIPFLVVTGHERDFISGRFLAAPYVGKPFGESALVTLASETFGMAERGLRNRNEFGVGR